MSENEAFKFSCPKCEGHIEAPNGYAGLSIPCPHCGQTITASPPSPTVPPATAPSRVAISLPQRWMMSFIFLAVAASIVFSCTHQHSASIQSNPKPTGPAVSPYSKPADGPAPPVKAKKSLADLKVGEITLDRQPNSGLVYAVGVVLNDSDYQRFGVKIELEVFNSASRKLGAASDYTQVIEPRKSWAFRALLTDAKAATAQLTRISEEP